MNIIKANNIHKTYKNDINVLNDINIEIKQGDFCSISGESGVGKSTLLHILGLLEKPDYGEIIIGDKAATNLKKKELNNIRMKTLGFVFQSFLLNESLNVQENVLLPMYINPEYSYEDMKKRARRLIELVGLEKRSLHYPNELSGGEKQRVAIARSLANDPKCILADEPTGNLDPENEEKILKLFAELVQLKKSVILISHSKRVSLYSNKHYILEKGNLELMS